MGDDGLIYLTETERPDEVINTSLKNWLAFLASAKAGDFDHFAEPHAE
jgi:hypothetical protein